MPKPEMAELRSGEYVFGAEGGRGTLTSSFFRRAAKKTTADIDDVAPIVVGAGYSHADHLKLSTTKTKKEKHSKRNDVFDLDDDWDANVEAPYESHKNGSHEVLPEVEVLNGTISRIQRFERVLGEPNVNLDQLRQLAYSGVPLDLRPRTWQLLLGYAPPNKARLEHTLAKKRQEYLDGIDQVFGSGLEQQIWHQISIDVKRTNPHISLYQFEETRRCLERILYLWAIRHPASGYVQGINDLATPFFQTFLGQHIGYHSVEQTDPSTLDPKVVNMVEADTYWCLSKLLDGIQDNYIHAQPGIHRQVEMLQNLCQRIDVELYNHFKKEGIEFMQFSFRWMNCLLMREVPMSCTIRIWDSYLAEGPQGFSEFHVYVCAAFLARWAPELKRMDFQDMMIFLQALPTQDWTDKDVELILSQAFMWQTLFKNAIAHLK